MQFKPGSYKSLESVVTSSGRCDEVNSNIAKAI